MASNSKSNNISNKGIIQQNISNCDSSSGISSSSATSLQRTTNAIGGGINGDGILGDHQHYHQIWHDESQVKGLKEADRHSESCGTSQFGYNSTTTGNESSVITSHNDQMQSEQTRNGDQNLHSSQNVNNGIFAIKESKPIGKCSYNRNYYTIFLILNSDPFKNQLQSILQFQIWRQRLILNPNPCGVMK